MNFKKFASLQRAFLFLIIFVLLIISSLYPQSAYSEDVLRVHFLDVEYADTILIELPDGRVIMVDAGEDATAVNVVQYLKGLNVKTVDAAIITHPHINHFEGFDPLSDAIKIHKVFVNGDRNSERGYDALLEKFQSQHIPVKILKKNDWLDDLPGTVRIEVLHPETTDASVNDNSIVIRLTHNNVVFLLTGDIGMATQDELIANFPDIGRADIIKAPHHGGPLSDRFIESFSDKIIVISTGPNRWDLPRASDLERLSGAIYRTDVHGTIVFESNGLSVKVNTSQQEGE